jgi:hypothetical protein
MSIGSNKYLQQDSNPDLPNVGAIIKDHVNKRKTYKAALARSLNRNLGTVMDYFKRKSLQSTIIWEMSMVFKHNFFAEIAILLPDTFSGPISTTIAARDEEIAQLKRDVEKLQSEKELLLQILKSK